MDALTIQLLGPLAVTRDGQPVAVPASKKTRALLAYLVLTGRPHTRSRLVDLLWDVPDDPRGALRWSLSKLRGLVGAERIVTEGDTVRFEPAGARVDALEVRRASGEARSTDDLVQLAAAFRGPCLEDLEQPDLFDYEAWRVAEQEAFRRAHVALLEDLIERLQPEEALPHARTLVGLEPALPERHARLVKLLRAAGRGDEASQQLLVSRQRLEAVGREAVQAFRSACSQPERRPADRQEVRLCTAPDGVRIAYAALGQGSPLLKTANWMTHLEYDWKSPLWRHLARELSQQFRLVRYDQRGNGLSDWDVADFSLDAALGDLEAVVEATGLERFPLLGISQGCRTAVAYAVKHPERVSALVLYGGSARGWRHRDPTHRETRSGLQALIREGWGRDIPAFRQVFTTLFMPEATPEQMAWFNELQRVSTSPENAVRLTEASSHVDVSGLLPRVQAPTLVMHATRDAMVPFEEGRVLAAGIPGARFVALESNNHLLLESEPAFSRFLLEIREFLA